MKKKNYILLVLGIILLLIVIIVIVIFIARNIKKGTSLMVAVPMKAPAPGAPFVCAPECIGGPGPTAWCTGCAPDLVGRWTIYQDPKKRDLKAIGGLIPNSIYSLNIGDLVLLFLADTSGTLYFNDHKEPLPTGCIDDIITIAPLGFTPLGPSLLWQITNGKISSTPMSYAQKLTYVPVPIYGERTKCDGKVKMTLDTRNFFPKYDALGHWNKSAIIMNGAFGLAHIGDGSCSCSVCVDGRFVGFPKGYSGPVEVDCNGIK